MLSGCRRLQRGIFTSLPGRIRSSELNILLAGLEPVVIVIGECCPDESVLQVIPCLQYCFYWSGDDESDWVVSRPVLVFQDNEDGMPAIPGIAVIGQKIIGEGLRIAPPREYPLIETSLPDDIVTVHVYTLNKRMGPPT